MPVTVTDKSVNNRTGTPTGGVGFDTEYKAFTFDGSNDGISTTSTATLSNHTASMWIKFEKFSGWAAAYAIRPASIDRNNAFLYANADGRFRLEAIGGSNSPYKDFGYRFEPGKWVHLTVLFEKTGLRDSKIYIDNVELVPNGTERSITDDITITGTTTVYIGSEPGYFFNGSVANFRLFNRKLSTDEIYQLYAYQKEYFGHGDLGMTLKAGRLNAPSGGIVYPHGRTSLDNFEEFTHPSAWVGQGGTVNYYTNGGIHYQRVGNFCTVSFDYSSFGVNGNSYFKADVPERFRPSNPGSGSGPMWYGRASANSQMQTLWYYDSSNSATNGKRWIITSTNNASNFNGGNGTTFQQWKTTISYDI